MSRRSISLVIAAIIIAGSPGAAGGVPRLDWVRKPTGDDLGRVYPREARDKGIPGWAKMRCKVTAKGTLTGCETVEEFPELMGFGPAVLRLAPKFQMSAKTPDGRSVEGASVEIPIRFQMIR
jgi:protein TonB